MTATPDTATTTPQPATRKGHVHHRVAVLGLGATGIVERNLCNVLRGDFSLPAVGWAPVLVSDTALTCERCPKALGEMGKSLSAFAWALRPQEQVDAERREYHALSYKWAADSFRKHVADMADDLRRKAAELERLAEAAPATAQEYHAKTAVPFGRENMATDAAGQATHLVMWMMANLNLDNLLTKAADVDARARGAKQSHPNQQAR